MMSSQAHSVQSRQKHRKVLGVGESADGKIPRSKISQLLGNEHLNHIVIEQGDYPRGLRGFQWLTCLLFGVVGLVNVFYPYQFYRSAAPNLKDPRILIRQVADDLHVQLKSASDGSTNAKQLEQHFNNLSNSLVLLDVPVRLFGAACLSLCALFFIVAVINRDNRRAIRIALLVEAVYFLIEIMVTWMVLNPFLIFHSSWFRDPLSLFWLSVYKGVVIFISIYFFLKTHPGRPYRERNIRE